MFYCYVHYIQGLLVNMVNLSLELFFVIRSMIFMITFTTDNLDLDSLTMAQR